MQMKYEQLLVKLRQREFEASCKSYNLKIGEYNLIRHPYLLVYTQVISTNSISFETVEIVLLRYSAILPPF